MALLQARAAGLYLTGQQQPVPAGNLLIEEVTGAAVTLLGDCTDRDRGDRIAARADELRAMDEVPYLIRSADPPRSAPPPTRPPCPN